MSLSSSSMCGGDGAGMKSVVWFRRDLRVEDNPALAAAARTAGEVVPAYVWSPEEDGPYFPGRVSRWWLSQSLKHLEASLHRLGAGKLVTRRSPDAVVALLQLVRDTGATHLFFNHLYDPISLVRDHRLKEMLTAEGIIVQSFNADLLYDPWEVNDDEGNPFNMFMPFWNRCLSMPYDPPAPLLPPKKINSGDLSMCPSDDLIFEDESERGSNALLARAWSPGWQNADKALTAFLNGPLFDYSVNRKKADSANTSLLSPYLHFGELSVRKVFHLVRMKQLVWSNEGNHEAEESCTLFLRSIGLREYSRYLCFNHPCSHEKPLLAHLRFFPWIVNECTFKFWRQGRTGYPLVDAGMRELWATGWLHDRIRVVVSSFFVKVLQLPWRWGMKYFWDTLLDADLESDALGWQYISGSLPDSRELDHIDNPQFEGYKFDPHGEYVRRWLPELARLPTEWIHHPWDAPASVLQAAGIELGSNYPLPIVELDAAKARLQEALSEMWQHEAASRAAMDTGMEEGLGDSSDVPLIEFPQDLQMEVHWEPARVTANVPTTAQRRQDQMVPTMTASLNRVETEMSADLGNSEDSRAEVPSRMHFEQRTEREEMIRSTGNAVRTNGVHHHNNFHGFRTDKKGQTALHMASKGQNAEILLELLKPNVSVIHVEDNKGNRPLHVATRKGNTIMVQTLISSEGIDINAVNKAGETAFAIAEKQGNEELVNILREAGGVTAKEQVNPPKSAKQLKQTVSDIRHDVQSQIKQTRQTKMHVHKIKKRIQKLHIGGLNNAINSNTVVAVLIATVAFASIFTIPGNFLENMKDAPYKDMTLGQALVASKPAFIIFLVFDSLALFISLAVVVVQTSLIVVEQKAKQKMVFVMNKLMWLACLCISAAFIALTYVVVGRNDEWLAWCTMMIGTVIMLGTIGSMCYCIITHRMEEKNLRRIKRSSMSQSWSKSFDSDTELELASGNKRMYAL